ncbi:hypothetical protein HETIRDRAFT_426287 [Heterobasidion irregulare TC 32-1]|uniref:Uncharacterized protein n=1 Tax=Heterobasidion irregulare (strain TC 32-1) TaxID=747525 RepID=W4KAE9_HETIT|nr:uncharacterized protein HETIRDRAFT_426287 [Heterobasidion irregulare TC 32-1]ETW82729.1 hypothetical protein HETIRDRAFT_426287 [Heterobasidion irregulare TC 32-1]
MSSSSSTGILQQQIIDAIEPPIVALAFEAGFYVLSLTSFSLSTYFLVSHKGLKTRAILAMWITTLVMFAVSTCHLALQWKYCKAAIVSQLSFLLLPDYLLSDVIVLWRVWIMWERNVKAVIFPLLLALASAVSGAIAASEGILSGWITDFTRMYGPSWVNISLLVTYASVLATNITTTVLIGVKLWQHRQLIKAHLRSGTYKNRVGNVFALLIESSIIYCIIWIVFIAVRISDGVELTDIDWYTVLSAIMVQISGIYPTAIIVLAALQNTAWDMSVGKEISQHATRTERHFATPNFRSVASTGAHEPHASGADVERGEV